MKHLTTLFVIFLSGSLLAQSEYCGAGTVWDAESQTCIVAENVELLDANLDGIIGVEDLLNLLSHFGDEDMDFDGIYDSVDDCVGAYDECGVCNGPGIPEGYCSCTEQIDALGICGGTCETDADGNGLCDAFEGACEGEQFVTFEGYDYQLVQIGDQCWFAENVRFLPEVSPPTDISNYAPRTYVYGYEGNSVDSASATENYAIYGTLFNAIAALEWGCPTGFTLPTQEQFLELRNTIAAEYNLDYGLVGGAMKTTGTLEGGSGLWQTPNVGATNLTGFSALPAGQLRVSDFESINEKAVFWGQPTVPYIYGDWNQSSTTYMDWDHGVMYVTNEPNPRTGHSVRCVKD